MQGYRRKGPAVLMLSLTFCFVVAVVPGLAEPTHEWTETYDGGAGSSDWCVAALVDPAGHLIIGGESYDGIGGSDMLVRKLDRQNHTTIWSTRYPAFDGNDMELSGMTWDGYGNIFVAGYVEGCLG